MRIISPDLILGSVSGISDKDCEGTSISESKNMLDKGGMRVLHFNLTQMS
jgi:hypothetical protein